MPRAAQIGAAHKLARRPPCYAPAFARCLAPDERAAAYAATPIAYPATTATADSASHAARDRLCGPEGARRRRTGSAGGRERFGTMMGAATGAPSRPQRCTSGRRRAQASRGGDLLTCFLLLARWPMADGRSDGRAIMHFHFQMPASLVAPPHSGGACGAVAPFSCAMSFLSGGPNPMVIGLLTSGIGVMMVRRRAPCCLLPAHARAARLLPPLLAAAAGPQGGRATPIADVRSSPCPPRTW